MKKMRKILSREGFKISTKNLKKKTINKMTTPVGKKAKSINKHKWPINLTNIFPKKIIFCQII